MNTLRIKDVCKSFKTNEVLRDVSFDIEIGKIYGLLGNNGEGKTTLLNIISNKYFFNSGTVEIDGECIFENDRLLENIHLMSERSFGGETQKIKSLIENVALLYPKFNMERAMYLCEKFKVRPNSKFNKLSTGYVSIVKCIIALSSGASVLMFDEPVLGLDIVHRDMFYKEMLKVYEEENCAIILSTHIIEELQNMLEHIIILNGKGVIVNKNTVEFLDEYYKVAGTTEAVKDFTKDKDVVYTDGITGLLVAIIKGVRPPVTSGLEVSKVELHQLFIGLTKGDR